MDSLFLLDLDMEYDVTGMVHMKMEHKKEWDTPQVKGVQFQLVVDPKLDGKMYFDEENGELTAEGLRLMTIITTQGLMGLIHLAHLKGHYDSAENFREVISQLENAFIQVATLEEDPNKKDSKEGA